MATLRGQLSPKAHGKKVRTLRLRIAVKGIPTDARVAVTDVMLQAGAVASGWSAHVTELPWSQGVVGNG